MDYQQMLAEALKGGLQNANLVALRGKADPLDNQLLAPFEHGQFTQQMTQQNPLLGAGVAGIMAPGYYIAKKLGYGDQGATPADIDQVFGSWQGLINALRNK